MCWKKNKDVCFKNTKKKFRSVVPKIRIGTLFVVGKHLQEGGVVECIQLHISSIIVKI